MYEFKYYSPTEVVFGEDMEQTVAAMIKKYGGSRVLVVYGGSSAKKLGLLDSTKNYLDAAGIFNVSLGGVVPNPLISKVYEGIELAKENNIDFILAIGGGSVIDTAKAIGYGLTIPGEDAWDLFDHVIRSKGCMPIGVILTIAAAGSESSNSCVITNGDTKEKRGYKDESGRPKFVIMNPKLTISLPDYQSMSGCADIMMHTMERYFTNGPKMEVTDALAEGLLKTVMKNALKIHDNPANLKARAEIMWAGSLSHNGLTGCGNSGDDFATHKLEHELGGFYDVTHGAGLCAMWGSWARYVYKEALPRFVKFAVNVMGVEHTGDAEETALKGIEALEEFFKEIDMPINIRELGIEPTMEEIDMMAKSCADGCGGFTGSAMRLYEEDMKNIYIAALS